MTVNIHLAHVCAHYSTSVLPKCTVHRVSQKFLSSFFDNLGTGKSCFSFLFSLQTGKSKGYAFVEFYSDEVAKVVADTMDNYLVFERIVKCKLKNLKNNKFKVCTPDTTNMSLNSLKFR